MKILLINNHTVHLPDLSAALTGHDVQMQVYEPGLDFHEEDKDLIILSGGGGQGLEIHDRLKKGKLWYEDQMNFILRTNKPVLGICMGFEVIASAYGAEIKQMPRLLHGHMQVSATKKGRNLLQKKRLMQFQSHRWQVASVSQKDFEVLADSDSGIEIIKHRKKSIFATQFHPEKGGSLELNYLINSIT